MLGEGVGGVAFVGRRKRDTLVEAPGSIVVGNSSEGREGEFAWEGRWRYVSKY